MAGITVTYHPRPGATWPGGEPDTVRAAYDLTRTAHAGIDAASSTHAGITLGEPGPEAEPGLEIEP